MSNFHLSEGAAHVLNSLSGVGVGYGLEIPEHKGWQRSLEELVEHELAEEIWGFAALTPAGRALVAELKTAKAEQR